MLGVEYTRRQVVSVHRRGGEVAALGGGATFILCFLFDFLRVVTAHVRIAYILFASIHRGLLSLLGTLWLLMRGLKRNTISGKVERQQYTAEEVLLAAPAFITVLFLLQTVAAHYFVHAFLWMMVWGVSAITWSWTLLCADCI